MNTEIIPNGTETALEPPLEFKNEKELIQWLQRHETPLKMVDIREGRGGKTFYYVRHQYITEKLNQLCRFDWDFEVLRERMDEDCVTVLGQLTLRVAGCIIRKSQYGSSDVKRSRDGKPLSIGDDFKAAASDSLKKCASLVGLGLDLSMPVKENTFKHLHAAGSKAAKGKDWSDRRHRVIRILTGGRTQSSKDLMEIEARILIAIIEGDLEAEIVQQAASILK